MGNSTGINYHADNNSGFQILSTEKMNLSENSSVRLPALVWGRMGDEFHGKSVSGWCGASDTTFPPTVGAFADNTFILNGRVDELALYKRLLTTEERAWLRNNGQGRAYADISTPQLPSDVSLVYAYNAPTHALSDHVSTTARLHQPQRGFDRRESCRNVLHRSPPQRSGVGYDPYIGRFAQADTIVPSGAQGLDRYAYANNSPIRYNDPSGHLPDSWISKFLGIKEDRLKTWREKNQQNLNYYNMLASAQAGDILRIKTQYKNSDGSTSYQANNYYVMETTDGDYGLFRLEDEQMFFAGSSSEDEATAEASVIVGYAIGKDDDYDNVFNFAPSEQVETSQYTLMPGWGNEHVKFDLEINYRRLAIDLAFTFGPPIAMLVAGALDVEPLTKGALIVCGVTTLVGAVDTVNTLFDSKYRYVYKK